MKIGCAAPNYDTLTDADYNRLWLLRASVLGTLWGATRHKAEVYRKVGQILPDCRYIIRVGPSGITTPDQFLRDTADALREAAEAVGRGLVSVRALNEINLPAEGGWSVDAYITFLRGVRKGWLWPSVPLVCSPLSMGLPGWQEWWGRFYDLGGMTLVDRIAVNLYPDAGQPIIQFLGSGKPIDVTEYGQLSIPPGEARGRTYADAMGNLARHPEIESCQFFILNGRSFGAWDERYCLTDDEARIVGERWGGQIAQKPKEQPVIKGVDISNNQGEVDLASVKAAGYQFVICKAAEDPTFVDRFLPEFWQAALEQELVRGAYHFARPSSSSPAASVAHFQRAIVAAGGFRAGDLYALDIEDERYDGSLHTWVAEWLDLAERVFGFPGFLYSAHYYMAPHDLEGHADLARYPLWYASYQSEQPPPPAGWDKLTIWQNSASARVPGVEGDCDTDVYFGDLASLRALGLSAPLTPDVPPDVLSALDVLWAYAGPDVNKQKAIVGVKVALGLQAA